MIFPITRIRILTKTITKTLTLTLTITFPRTKTLTLTRTLTFTRIWINSKIILHQALGGTLNTPASISKKDDGSKKQKLFVTSGSIFNTTAAPLLRKIPLSLDINLPSTVFRFGTSEENEIAFSCHLDSYVARNTGNSLLHMWIMTTYPEIVASYERYNDDKPLHPIILDCTILSSGTEKDASKLSAVVTYKTRYSDVKGDMVLLSFSLGGMQC